MDDILAMIFSYSLMIIPSSMGIIRKNSLATKLDYAWDEPVHLKCPIGNSHANQSSQC